MNLELQALLLRKQCSGHLTIAGPHLQCEGVTRNGLTVGQAATLPPSLASVVVCQRAAIRSPLKYVSHQTMVFPDTFSMLCSCPKKIHNQPGEQLVKFKKNHREREQARSKIYLEKKTVGDGSSIFLLFAAGKPPHGGNSPYTKLTV